MDFKKDNEVVVKVPGYNEEQLTIPMKIVAPPISGKNKIEAQLHPGEIQVLLVSDLEIK